MRRQLSLAAVSLLVSGSTRGDVYLSKEKARDLMLAEQSIVPFIMYRRSHKDDSSVDHVIREYLNVICEGTEKDYIDHADVFELLPIDTFEPSAYVSCGCITIGTTSPERRCGSGWVHQGFRIKK